MNARDITEKKANEREMQSADPTPLHDAQGRVTGAVNLVLDLTDAKRAELAMARLAAIVETSDDAIISKSLDGIITTWNRGAERLFGYTALEAVGRPVTMLIPAEMVDEEAGILRRIRRGERIHHYETVRRRKDGTLVHLSLSVSPILDENGKVVGASKIARDISERKRYEEALRLSDAQLQAELADTQLLHSISSELVYEGNAEVLYGKIVDAAVTIMRSDFASIQMLYPERGEAGELRLLAFRGFNPQAAKFWEWVRSDSTCTCGIALARGTRVIEEDVAKPQFVAAGSPHHATYLQTGIQAVQSTPLRSRGGELVGMISTHWRQPHRPSERDWRLLDLLARQAADLIERTRAEEDLRESETRFRTLCDYAPSLIWVTGSTGCEFVNRTYLEFTGASMDDVTGLGWARYLHPEEREQYVGRFQASAERGELFVGEHRHRRADGIYRQMKTVGVPRFSSTGELLGYVGSTHDITDVKEAEDVLRDAARRKDEFLAMLSHELRNPLAPIRHAVTLLQQVDDAEIQRQACGILDRQVGHMTRLVEDLLDITRITRGDINVYKRVVDLTTIVQAAVETSRPLVEGSGHRLDITLPKTPVSVVADQHRLAQVVSNLLNNAARYTPRGGRIGLEVSRASDAAAISVRDNGIGIPADELPRLFGMFTQLDSARGRAPGGLGIGLALARRLVELHGGTIEARSEGPGRGSEFTVRIPLPAADGRPGASV